MSKTEKDIQWVSFPDDMISNDSSFIGDANTTAQYERKSAAFNPRTFWDVHEWNMQCLSAQEAAARNHPASSTMQSPEQGLKRKHEDDTDTKAKDTPKSKILKVEEVPFRPQHNPASASAPPPEPFNPYASEPSAYQLHETIPQFLSRLRPSNTTLANTGYHWIWIANPHSKLRHTDSDTGGFRQLGFALLESYMTHHRTIEEQNPDRPTSTITRILKPEREKLESDIFSLAKEKKVTTGKWMLFPRPQDVDAVWAKIASATLDGRLGCSAKVATDDGNTAKPERLICVYTEDFSDIDDVKRVLAALQDLNLVHQGKTIYYKCDAYTYLDIVSQNDYRLKASMYNSRDLMGTGVGDGTKGKRPM